MNDTMAGQPLWDSAADIVLKMKDLIQSENTERMKESRMGWQYRLLNECKAMKADMEARDYRVRYLIAISL